MRKKVVSLLTVMALAIATLAGCASSTDTNATTGTEAATEATDEAAADDAAVEETADAEEATEDAAQVQVLRPDLSSYMMRILPMT